MRIEYEIKLGFKDVMIRPKRSTLKSRSQVSLERTFSFRNSGKDWTGVPLIAANMDTVGTFEMAKALAQHQIMTAVHKHYPVEAWHTFLNENPAIYPHIALSTGTGEVDEEKIAQILKNHPKLQFLCIDVANGYSEHFVEFVKRSRQLYPEITIIAGNVVTGDPSRCRHHQSRHWSRLRMYHKNKNRCRLSATFRDYRMCRCRAWPWRAYYIRWWLQDTGRCSQSLWWWRRLRDAGRHVCRA